MPVTVVHPLASPAPTEAALAASVVAVDAALKARFKDFVTALVPTRTMKMHGATDAQVIDQLGKYIQMCGGSMYQAAGHNQWDVDAAWAWIYGNAPTPPGTVGTTQPPRTPGAPPQIDQDRP